MVSSARVSSDLRGMARGSSIGIAIISLGVLVMLAIPAAQGQSFQVLHNFTGGADGASPSGGVIFDSAGNLYGTSSYGGIRGDNCFSECGTVFRLSHIGSAWIPEALYNFHNSDGADPVARVVFGPDGLLYGTTFHGGISNNGVVFSLQPTSTPCNAAECQWSETVLWNFTGIPDGADPGIGDLAFDAAGNIYGTTYSGGANFLGSVYELQPTANGWAESILYSFGQGPSDGKSPWDGVVFDRSGNLYTTTFDGGVNAAGTVVQLTRAGAGWTERVLYNLRPVSDGEWPYGGVILDQVGNLYGTTAYQGPGNGGTVFKFNPSGFRGQFTVLHSFSSVMPGDYGPLASLTMDAAGSLYGTTTNGGQYQYGTVFKLTRSGGSWTYTDLHDFTGGADGAMPYSRVTLDAGGSLYGTASGGGAYNHGVVWEIVP